MSTAAASPSFICNLKDRKEVAEGTMSFEFEKPSGWTFKAGQYLDMTLLDPPESDAEGNVRSFSIASAPHDETLLVATRMRDTAFKRVLKTMPFGTAVKIEGPSGDLILQNDSKRTAVSSQVGLVLRRFEVLSIGQRRKSCRITFSFSIPTGGQKMRRSSRNSSTWKGKIRSTS
jgi:NAD(P)H-flavin reductase